MENLKRAKELIGKDVEINEVEVCRDVVLVYYNDSGEEYGSMVEFSKDIFFQDTDSLDRDIFVLSEIVEDDTNIRTTNILMISKDIYKIREYMEDVIERDPYDLIEQNGILTHEEDYFETNYNDSLFILTITDHLIE